jgi:hypothetical protein
LTPIWIDAICINQKDPNERNYQIVLMSRIYATASVVQIYLDGKCVRSKEAFEYVRQEYDSMNGPKAESVLKHFSYQEVSPELIRRSLGDILESSWFTRVWVRKSFDY